jgi:subtilisin family serine protease
VAVASSADANFAAKAARIAGVRSVVPDVKLQWIDPGESHVVLDDAAVNSLPADAVVKSPDPNEPYSFLQWGLDAVHAPEAWASGARGAGVRVAVLDTGIDVKHPDLTPNLNLSLSTSFVPGEPVAFNPAIGGGFSHATHVAGIIAAADNGIGTVGVAPQAEIMAVKVLSDDGIGSFDSVMAGIVYAADHDADIINMSLGATLPRRSGYVDGNGTVITARDISELTVALGRATTYADQQGTTIIASAGNGSIDRDHDQNLVVLPADLPHVITVSATGPLGWAHDPTTNLDVPAYYTNYGQSAIDFAAPGGNVDFDLLNSGEYCTVSSGTQSVTEPCWVFDSVLSTNINGWAWASGTSMAAPHVAGVAALIIGRNGGDMDPAHVEAALRASADDLGKPGRDAFYGYGLVDASNAV